MALPTLTRLTRTLANVNMCSNSQIPFRLHNALTFFYTDPDARLACARSRLGGTMLMAAEPAGAEKYTSKPAATQ